MPIDKTPRCPWCSALIVWMFYSGAQWPRREIGAMIGPVSEVISVPWVMPVMRHTSTYSLARAPPFSKFIILIYRANDFSVESQARARARVMKGHRHLLRIALAVGTALTALHSVVMALQTAQLPHRYTYVVMKSEVINPRTEHKLGLLITRPTYST